MKNNKGFTLTEILLAVMIVGIIGVALAALTTAASRESGVGRSKVLLRNNLSIALRQLRQDVRESSRVLYVRGDASFGSSDSSAYPLLMLGKNVDQEGNAVSSRDSVKYITYCFVPGEVDKTSSGATVQPRGAYDGGVIYRYQYENSPSWDGNLPTCNTAARYKFLSNVKYIPSTYPVPYFGIRDFSGTYNIKTTGEADRRKNLASVLEVNWVTELPSNPVVNDVTEETFLLPNGFGVKDN